MNIMENQSKSILVRLIAAALTASIIVMCN